MFQLERLKKLNVHKVFPEIKALQAEILLKLEKQCHLKADVI